MFWMENVSSSIVFEDCTFICYDNLPIEDRCIIQVGNGDRNSSKIILKNVTIENNIVATNHSTHGLTLVFWTGIFGNKPELSLENVVLSQSSNPLQHVVKFAA